MPTIPAPGSVAASVQGIVAGLAQVNVALPVVISTVVGIIGIVKALRGDVAELAPVIAQLEAQLAENKSRGEAEVARLKALLGK